MDKKSQISIVNRISNFLNKKLLFSIELNKIEMDRIL